MKVCDAIAQWCVDIEAPFVAGIPGFGMLGIIDKLSIDQKVPFILTRHEEGAAMMAYSYAFRTRTPAVVIASKAPGSTNLAIGVMGAFIESLPLIVITAQTGNTNQGYESFEEIDLEAFFKPITKWSVQLNNPSRAIGVLNEAYRRSMTGRPGPVHVAIPYDFMNQEIASYIRPALPMKARSSDADAEDIAALVTTASRPLVIVGGGLPTQNAKDVLSIARSMRAPIVTSWLRKPLPDRDPNVIGMAGIGGSPAAQSAIHDADVILALGCRFSEQMTEHFRMKFATNAKLIHVDIDPAVLGRVYPVEVGVVADLGSFLPPLADAVHKAVKSRGLSVNDTWLSELQKTQTGYRRSLDAKRPTGAKVSSRHVVKELRRQLDDDALLVLDSGNYLHWAEQYFSVKSAGLFHYPTSGTMGFGIPGAIGAKIAEPNAFVCALVGDGGFAMTMGELETAMRIGTAILVVIINNGTLGQIRMQEEADFDGRHTGVDFTEQHFAHVPKAFGAFGSEVSREEDLLPALKEAVEVVRGGVCAVVDVHVSSELAAGPLAPWWTDQEG